MEMPDFGGPEGQPPTWITVILSLIAASIAQMLSGI